MTGVQTCALPILAFGFALGVALSPTASFNAGSGQVFIQPSALLAVWGTGTVSPSLAVWGTGTVWGSLAVWGTSVFLNANCAVWGTGAVWGTIAVWGTSTPQAFSTVWGSLAVWGTGQASGETVKLAINGDN